MLSIRIPLVHRMSYIAWISRIMLLRPKFFICKYVWIHWVRQKKKLCMQRPYWRRFLTCKWNLSFFSCDQTKNNMQLFHRILVLHLEIWCCIPNKLQLYSVLLLILKDFHILAYSHDRSSKRNWAFFGKNSSLKIFK